MTALVFRLRGVCRIAEFMERLYNALIELVYRFDERPYCLAHPKKTTTCIHMFAYNRTV